MSRGRLLRFLNRQLSLPVSTISRVMREAIEGCRGHPRFHGDKPWHRRRRSAIRERRLLAAISATLAGRDQ